MVYVGNDEVQQRGVAIKISARAKGALMEWMPISKKIITARFYSKYKTLTVVQAYAPTSDAMDEEKDEFYNHLQECRTLFRTATEIIYWWRWEI